MRLRECFCLLEKSIWRSHIYTATKVHLCRTYILPVLLHGCETWTVTKTLAISALMPSTPGVGGKSFGSCTPDTLYTNESVRGTTGCVPVSERVTSFRLRFFGHLARSNPEEDYHCVIAAALRPPSDWRRPAGRPRATWLRTVGEDLQSQNFWVHAAWKKAKEIDTWHKVVSTETLC